MNFPEKNKRQKEDRKMNKKGGWGFFWVALILGVWALSPGAFGQEKAKPEGTAKEGGALAIARLIVGTGVEKREPVGEAEKFPLSAEKVYCFLEATNIPKDMEITLVWFNGEKEIGKNSLALKQGLKWRTWAYKNLRGLKGEWKIEAKDANGKVLKEIKFKVE
jgi:hypothetical protein